MRHISKEGSMASGDRTESAMVDCLTRFGAFLVKQGESHGRQSHDPLGGHMILLVVAQLGSGHNEV